MLPSAVWLNEYSEPSSSRLLSSGFSPSRVYLCERSHSSPAFDVYGGRLVSLLLLRTKKNCASSSKANVSVQFTFAFQIVIIERTHNDGRQEALPEHVRLQPARLAVLDQLADRRSSSSWLSRIK
jgi:hypothetical protein